MSDKWWNKDIPVLQIIINAVIACGTLAAVIVASRSLKISNDALQLTRKSIENSDSINDISLSQE